MRIAFVFLICLAVMPELAVAQAYLPQFDTTVAAQAHCPYDATVEINPSKAVFSKTKQSSGQKTAYVCRQEAIDSGYGGLVTHIASLPKPPAPTPANATGR